MNILFAAAEMTPFAKTGGLADVVGALPKALAQRGHRVQVVVPAYPAALSAGIPFRRQRRRLQLRLGSRLIVAGQYAADFDGVTVWLLDVPELYERPGLYGTSAGDYADNHVRFATLSLGAIALARMQKSPPDIIHCHDWHAALLPALLRWYTPDPFFAASASVLTVHNLAFQGLFPATVLADLGLPAEWLRMERAEFYGQFGFLKAGLQAADKITTVSPTYRRETLGRELGCGLEGVLNERANDYVGILNGLDFTEWDPATDQRLPANYSVTSLPGKQQCKEALQQRLGLPVAPKVPLLVMISRLTEQKGCDLLLSVLPRLVAAPVQVVLLGVGDEPFMLALGAFAREEPRNISVNLGFHTELGPFMYAGADMLLMPSRFEPCGISQLIALRYGTVPIVRRTGGLADTVEAATATTGNGFLFSRYDADSFWQTIQEAVALYQNRPGWQRLMQRGMMADYSWNRSVEAYETVYAEAAEQRRGGAR